MKTLISVFLIFGFSFSFQNNDWQTYYEKSGFKETPRYAETIEYCKKLADASAMIQYSTFGKSPQDRELPLLIINKNGNFTAEKVRQSDNIVFLIQAGIHSGEIDGKDAGFMLIRDLVIKGINKELLDHVTILFIPIFNVDGHERFSAYNRINQNGPVEMGWRTTAQNYNLNRDYLKADSPEMHGFLKLYHEWLPEFFADCHVTDGADFQYVITYAIETIGVQDKGVIEWTENVYNPAFKIKMEKDGFPIIDYVQFRNWHDPRSGLEGGVSKPRYSTGYTSLLNRPGLLIETHMLKPFKDRVDGTFSVLKSTLEILNKEYHILKEIIAKADREVQTKNFREENFPLTFSATKDSSVVDFLGYEYTVEKSNISAGDWFRYSKEKVTFKLPYFNSYQIDKFARLPEAYIIPVEWTEIISRLQLHGIGIFPLKEEKKLVVDSYKFLNEKWTERPFENHHNLKFEMKEIREERIYPAGSIVIPMDQIRAKVIAHILEPEAPDSYVFWGYFDPVFERKEYVESYVMEEFARYMLSSDDGLREEFDEKKELDPEFAENPKLILDWFYQKSPYWDLKINIYPVGKVFDEDVLQEILN